MALNASTLATSLAAAANCPPGDAAGQAAWLAIATAIVDHIKANAVVSPTALAGANLNVGGTDVTGTGKIL